MSNFVIDFVVGAVKIVGRLFFGSSYSSGSTIEMDMFIIYSSLFLWICIIYILVKIASSPFQNNEQRQDGISLFEIDKMVNKNLEKAKAKKQEKDQNFKVDRVK